MANALQKRTLAADTTITVVGPIQNAPNGGVLLIDTEQVFFGHATDTLYLDCVRGFNGTSAADHDAGAVAEDITDSPQSTVVEMRGADAPVDGITGVSIAPTGSRYTRTSNGTLYLNTGTITEPVWTLVSVGTSAVPGGTPGSVQFNDSGSFGGSDNLKFADSPITRLDLTGTGASETVLTLDQDGQKSIYFNSEDQSITNGVIYAVSDDFHIEAHSGKLLLVATGAQKVVEIVTNSGDGTESHWQFGTSADNPTTALDIHSNQGVYFARVYEGAPGDFDHNRGNIINDFSEPGSWLIGSDQINGIRLHNSCADNARPTSMSLSDAGNATLEDSSMFTLQSTTQGALLSRMDTTSRDAIPTPATGLIIYNTTDNTFQYWNGSSWVPVGSATPAGSDGQIQFNSTGAFGASPLFTVLTTPNPQLNITDAGSAEVNVNLNSGGRRNIGFYNSDQSVQSLAIDAESSGDAFITAGIGDLTLRAVTGTKSVRVGDAGAFLGSNPEFGVKTSRADYGMQFEANPTVGSSYGVRILAGTNGTDVAFAIKDVTATDFYLQVSGDGRIGMGADPNDTPSARLSVTSTIAGFLPPRMTTAQRTAIGSPDAGLMVYDTDLAKLTVFTTQWEAVTSVGPV